VAAPDRLARTEGELEAAVNAGGGRICLVPGCPIPGRTLHYQLLDAAFRPAHSCPEDLLDPD
jgi:hypothetical protein